MTIEMTIGSGNVFADLAIKNPTEAKLKAEVIGAIADLMEDFGLSQVAVAKATGIDQGALSLTMRGRSSRISVGRLIEIYTTLGGKIDMEFTSPESLPLKVREGR